MYSILRNLGTTYKLINRQVNKLTNYNFKF